MAIPFVEIMLDKPRKLRFGMGAVLEFEQLTGLKLMEISENIQADAIVKIAWVMLKQEDKDLTLEGAAKLFDEYFDGNLQDMINKVTEALSLAFKVKDSKNGEPPIVEKNS